MKIVIDPRLKYNYASWYLLGIMKLYCGISIIFDIKPFQGLTYNKREEYNSGFAFIVMENSKEYRVFIDTEDRAVLFDDRYQWCDVYGKVNPTKEQCEEFDKLYPIGPEFGVTLGWKLNSVFLCFRNYLKAKTYTNIGIKDYLKDYLYTNIRRRKLAEYEKILPIKPNYVFHASTLWYNQFAATDTNMYRGEFLKACKRAGMDIEGGLFYVNGEDVLREMPDYPKYKEIYSDFIYDKRLSIDDYIRKTKESVLVFNTPSVCECHGWKLAEYLCMGKAIISTPLKREMPEKMTHGENIHFINSPEEIYDAVMKINSDEEYRKKLEKGARAYYERWLAPEIVVKKLIDSCK